MDRCLVELNAACRLCVWRKMLGTAIWVLSGGYRVQVTFYARLYVSSRPSLYDLFTVVMSPS